MDDRLVTIARFGSALNANLARARLEAAGIHAFVSNEIGSAYAPLPSQVELQVAESDESEALAILSETHPAVGPAAAPDDDWRTREEPERCPICEASFVNQNEPALPLRLLRFLLTIFLPLPDSAFASRGRSCGVCGYRWREGDSGVRQNPETGS